MASTPMFDHEKLDVYQLELKFLTWVTQFLVDIGGPSETQKRELITQLDRASLSALLNTAELYRARENELGVMQPFEDDDEHEDERINR